MRHFSVSPSDSDPLPPDDPVSLLPVDPDLLSSNDPDLLQRDGLNPLPASDPDARS